MVSTYPYESIMDNVKQDPNWLGKMLLKILAADFKWSISDKPACTYEVKQITKHIVLEFPRTKFKGRVESINKSSAEVINYCMYKMTASVPVTNFNLLIIF